MISCRLHRKLMKVTCGRPFRFSKGLTYLSDWYFAFPVRFAFREHAAVRGCNLPLLAQKQGRQIHADIAAILKRDFPEQAENEPEVLAHHYQEAGNHELAIRCWFEAGQRALSHLFR